MSPSLLPWALFSHTHLLCMGPEEEGTHIEGSPVSIPGMLQTVGDTKNGKAGQKVPPRVGAAKRGQQCRADMSPWLQTTTADLSAARNLLILE